MITDDEKVRTQHALTGIPLGSSLHLLDQSYRSLAYRHILGSHFVAVLRNTIWTAGPEHDTEPIVKAVLFKKFEHLTHECFTGEAAIVFSTLHTPSQAWLLSGQYCLHWNAVKLDDMKEITREDAAILLSTLALPPYNNGSKGISELIHFEDETKCERDILHQCSRGTVRMDPWLNRTLQFQRSLSFDTELNYVQFFGTHNSFNNKADGYGTGDFYLGELLELLSEGKWDFVWAQQWFTMTDQLNMGVREMMLDPVYVFGEMRLCHCGTTFKWVDRVIKWIDKVLNTTVHFDSDELGCLPYDRSLVSGLTEIHNWLMSPWNKEEFILLHINDEGRTADWDHIGLIQQPIKDTFGDILFTPVDKNNSFPSRWPTQRELLSMNKHIIVFGDRVANDDIFSDFTLPRWDFDTVKYFSPAPKCGSYTPDQWYIVGGESQVVGPIYDGPKEEGLVVLENLPYLLQCGVSISSMDLVSPHLLGGAVWSWSPGYPDASRGNCTALNTSDSGRWISFPCHATLLGACQNTQNRYEWSLTQVASTENEVKCPAGYEYAAPNDGHMNWLLYTAARTRAIHDGSNNVWIKLHV